MIGAFGAGMAVCAVIGVILLAMNGTKEEDGVGKAKLTGAAVCGALFVAGGILAIASQNRLLLAAMIVNTPLAGAVITCPEVPPAYPESAS